MSSKTTCGLVSLGCSKNLVDSEVMLGLLQQAGLEIVPDATQAEVLIVNTCTFLREADQESIDTLREMAAHRRRGACRALVVTGCMVQRYAEHLHELVPEVDALVGTGDFHRIVEAVRTALGGDRFSSISTPTEVYDSETPRLVSTPSWTAYVKIAEGCDQQCAFCVIPQVRGRYRSRSIEDIAQECERLVGAGAKEIVFLSQDSTRYGLDRYGKPSLAALIQSTARVDGLQWLRLLYWFPSFVSDELLQAVTENANVCQYIDLPFQHADSEMLRAMRRPGTDDSNRRLLQRIRNLMPDAAIRTAFIVGYPGETDAQFETLLSFVRDCEFDHVAAFTFSQEPGTPAAEMEGQVPAAVAQERYERLLGEQQGISLKRNQAWIGRSLPVLVEKVTAPGEGSGRSFRDAPEVDGSVVLAADRLRPGEFVPVEITSAEPYHLVGVAQE
jgi:ribosomal protein S12 methylthiotransferase